MGTTKEEILDYVMETPGNTNRAVLSSLLNDQSASDEAVTYTEQEPTTAQQMQARKNLGLYRIEGDYIEIEWDGNVGDRPELTVEVDGQSLVIAAKVSSTVPPSDFWVGGKAQLSDGSVSSTVTAMDMVESLYEIRSPNLGLIAYVGYAGEYIYSPIPEYTGHIIVPEDGIYFLFSEEEALFTSYLFGGSAEVYKIEDKYLPKTYVDVVFNTEDFDNITANKSFDEVWQAIQNDERIIYKLNCGFGSTEFYTCLNTKTDISYKEIVLAHKAINFRDKVDNGWDALVWTRNLPGTSESIQAKRIRPTTID